MSINNSKKKHARLLFMQGNLTAKEIAATFDVSENTVSTWRKNGNWDEERATNSMMPENLVREYLMQSQMIIDEAKKEKRPLSTKEVDQLKKLSKCVIELRGTTSPQVVMQVTNSFVKFLAEIDMDLSKKVADYAVQYVDNHLKVM